MPREAKAAAVAKPAVTPAVIPALGPVAVASRQGLLIPLGPFTARLGGGTKLQKVLNALTIVEEPAP